MEPGEREGRGSRARGERERGSIEPGEREGRGSRVMGREEQ